MSYAADRAEIAAQAATLDALADAAERCSAEGRHETACALVQSAAGIAALRHPGRFADARLEAVLAAAATAIPTPTWRGGGGVLHVLSNALDVGGHTRLAWRWMERDGAHVHSFVVTRPAPGPAPAPLTAAASATGGREFTVPGVRAGLLATAAALRELAAGFDLLVLHTQPNDPLAALAFAGVTDRAPTLLCNHADHCFWLGRDAADAVVGHREVAATLATVRRGVPAARTATLALPPGDATPTTADARTDARARLGIPVAARVLLTVGSAYKFAGGEQHLLDALLPLLSEDQQAVLIAVGPPAEGRWAAASSATAGRVLATGVLPDVTDLLAAADVFVESYPCSSGTAAVEAAASGLPVVAYAPDPVEADLLGSAGAAAGLWPVATDAQALRDAIRDARADRDALDAHHDADRWRAALADAEARARALGPVRPDELADPTSTVDATDLVLHRLHARTGHRHADAVVERWRAQAAALAAWPALEGCFVEALLGPSTHLELARCHVLAVAAPAVGEEADAVEALRTLLLAGLAERGVLAVDPALVEEVFPALEAALAAGVEVDLDVTATSAPSALVMPGGLAVRTPRDGFGPHAGQDLQAQRLTAGTALARS